MRYSTLPFVVLIATLAFAGLEDSGVAFAKDGQPAPDAAASTRVVIVDRGMNMAIGALRHPPGWVLHQDIATDLQTAQYARYVLDLTGPEGMIRGLGMLTYQRFAGQEFEPVVERAVRTALQGFEGLEFGEIEPNKRRMGQARFQEGIRQARANGMDLQAVQAPFRASSNGRTIAGRVEVDHSLFFDGGQHTGGMVSIGLLVSTPDRLATLTRISDAIGLGFEPNPAYDGARAKVIDTVAARQYSEHQQRMSNNQAQFESHQKMMQGRYDSAYEQNQQWLQDFRSSGTTPSGTRDYGSHERFIDSINETTSFDDPDSGQRTTRDGQFDRWATDGHGNYVGSDDPNFDPNALDGNYEEVDPLR